MIINTVPRHKPLPLVDEILKTLRNRGGGDYGLIPKDFGYHLPDPPKQGGKNVWLKGGLMAGNSIDYWNTSKKLVFGCFASFRDQTVKNN